ncbi:MAG TPA: NAD(P)H-binding protein [Chitinophaga sp.]|uniref:NAD(P)-dependent oxidoreductase n=1 Tax=Chitinophaga sp. TaxID=1869181 RepID=UPI002D0586B8|nr:NAD(P)H-binding protein [Chitinophaga sp.]HVI45867.1 NAD(P)H-binding protein [Chitinophaga sp.]
MKKVGVIGATGKSGSLIVKELVENNFDVTAIVRNIDKAKHLHVAILHKDLFELGYDDIKDFDVVINAFNAPIGEEALHQSNLQHLSDILKDQPAPQLYMLGGAGSLFLDDSRSKRVVELEGLPPFIIPTAQNEVKAYDKLVTRNDFNWIYFCPPLNLDPEGETTGKFMVSGDILTMDLKGNSYISYGDYAKGVVDVLLNQPGTNHTTISIVGQ